MGTDPRWGSRDRDVKALAIMRTLQDLRGQNITSGCWLDVGCGSGLIAATLANHVHTIQGVDPEPWSRWSDLEFSASNLRFLVGSVNDLPDLIPDASVDVAICNQVYEHVPDPRRLVAELYRVLKSGGICYFAGPNLLWPIEPHVFLPFVRWLPRKSVMHILSKLGIARIHGLDAWYLGCRRLRRILRAGGFSVYPAFRAREQAGVANGERGLATRLASKLPAWLENLTLPLHPGFVITLRKSCG